MTPEEKLLLHEAFDLTLYKQRPTLKTIGWLRRLNCTLGVHLWGFVHCPTCKRKDERIAEMVEDTFYTFNEAQYIYIKDRAQSRIKEIEAQTGKPFKYP